PYKTLTDRRARDFARWFWNNAEFEGEAVCLKGDLGLDYSPDTFSQLSWSAMYLCNREIYSPRRRSGKPIEWDAVSRKHPLRCVQFKATRYDDYDQEGFNRWLAGMQDDYTLVSRDAYSFPCYDKRERNLRNVHFVEVFKFIPRENQTVARENQTAVRENQTNVRREQTAGQIRNAPRR
ncbi:MAG: hypothetical protein N2C14_24555, partial [Planctomycetales bacterium]